MIEENGEPMFTMSMYASSKDLYKAKAEHYLKRFEEESAKAESLQEEIDKIWKQNRMLDMKFRHWSLFVAEWCKDEKELREIFEGMEKQLKPYWEASSEQEEAKG